MSLWPWSVAKRCFYEQPSSIVVDRLGRARSIAGLAFAGIIAIPFGASSSALWADAGYNMMRASLIGIGAVVLLSLVFCLTSPGGMSRVLIPVRNILLFVSAVVLPEMLVGLVPVEEGNGTLGVLILVRLWTIPFGITSAWYATRSLFRVGKIDERLGPVTAIAVATVVAVLGLVEFDPKGLPVVVYLLMILCGLASTVGLAVWELRTMHAGRIVAAAAGGRSRPRPPRPGGPSGVVENPR